MPRRPRHYIPGHSYHIVQRGVNRQATFFQSEDYQYYIGLWRHHVEKYGLLVHSYCLMSNHVHFLVTPEKTDSISAVTRVVGSSYAIWINRKYDRTGTLWEGRHWASLVQDEMYLMRCHRYIESNPIRALMCSDAADYPWSSYYENSNDAHSWLVPHALYKALAPSGTERARVYRDLFHQETPLDDIELFTKRFRSNLPVAERSFLDDLEGRYGIEFGTAQRGRPPLRKK